MKRILSAIFLFLLTLSSFGCSNKNSRKNIIELTGFQESGINHLAEVIINYYKNYEVLNYTEFKEMSLFECEDSDSNQILFAQAKTKRYLGFDTFTTVYSYRNSSNEIDSILTATNVEKKNPQILVEYNEYRNRSNINFVNRKLANDYLQKKLNQAFKGGMDAEKEGDETYQGGDETLLTKDFIYKIEKNNEISIVKWIGTEDYVKIPERIDGLPVTRIKEKAFGRADNRNIIKKDPAFDSGIHIETVYLPDTIKYIEKGAFRTTSYFGDSCILDYIFIPKGVEYVDPSAFHYSTKLFFKGYDVCDDDFETKYINVSEDDFFFHNGLVYKTFREGPLGPEAILVDCLFTTTKAEVFSVVKIHDVTMSVTKLGDGAFSDCRNLESVTFPTLLEDFNFNCFDFGSYSISEFLRKYPKLQMNRYLNGYYLPTAINPYYLFVGPINEGEKIVLCDNTELLYTNYSISADSFITINGIDYLPSETNPYYYAANSYYGIFEDKKIIFNEESRIIHPTASNSNDTILGGYTFYIGKNAAYVYQFDFSSQNKFVVNPLNEIYSSDSTGSLFGNYGLTLMAACGYSYENSSYTVPSHVWYIGNAAFSWSHFTSVTLSESTLEVGRSSFYCSNVLNVYAGRSLKNPGGLFVGYRNDSSLINVQISTDNPYFKAADKCITSHDGTILYGFYGSQEQKVFVIPSNIKFIEYDAFENGIRNVYTYIIPNYVINVGESSPYYQVKIYCEKEQGSYYITNALFGNVSIVNDAVYVNGSLIQCFYNGDLFVMEDVDKYGNQITKIGSSAFFNSNLKSIQFGSYVNEIGDYAFHGCQIENLIIPSSVSIIGKAVFHACNNIEWIIIPSSVTSFGGGTFTYCTNCKVFLDMDTIPSTWSDDWNGSYSAGEGTAMYFLRSQWHYENGVPVMN